MARSKSMGFPRGHDLQMVNFQIYVSLCKFTGGYSQPKMQKQQIQWFLLANVIQNNPFFFFKRFFWTLRFGRAGPQYRGSGDRNTCHVGMGLWVWVNVSAPPKFILAHKKQPLSWVD